MNLKCITFLRATLFCIASFGLPAAAQSVYENYTFLTVAGSGDAGPGWFDGVGNAARFDAPGAIARDASGNLYLADSANNTIRKITPGGLVTTVAGLAGVSGTADGLGAAARFKSPFGIALDGSGNIYVADSGNHTIRRISPAGAVITLAGSAGVSGSTDGTGTAARFHSPEGVVVDSSNNVYVADSGNHTIRKITPAGVVTTFAGSAGNSGSVDKTGINARFNFPTGVALDAGGNIYVADNGNDLIRKITPAALVSTVAGSTGKAGSANGTGTNALFSSPFGLTVDGSTNVYVADTSNHTLRKITPDGAVTTLAGSAGNPGSTDDTGTAARFDFPVGIVVDSDTNLFVSDFSNDSVRKVTAALAVTTFAGLSGGSGTADGAGSSARFNSPSDITLQSDGSAYIADFLNNTIRKMTSEGVVTTLAGRAGVAGTNNGAGSAALFNNPLGVALDQAGNVVVADSANHTIRQVTPLGNVTTIAGSAGNLGTNDGTGVAAEFNQPFSVAVDTNDNIFVADTHNHAIRKIAPDGTVTTFAGTIASAGTNDGTGLNAQFNFPEKVTFDGNDNLYVADEGSSTIRKISPDGQVTTLAGVPKVTGSVDGTGGSAEFRFPFGVATDASGNLYVGDTDNNTIRKITPAGVVTTIAGAVGRFGSLDGTGSDARFNSPEGLAVDGQGNIYVADAANHSIRKGYRALPDEPTVDLIGAHVGVTRQFGITNLTTTSWSWSLIRRPANSSAQLSATNTVNPTFTPDVEDVYVVRFQGWNNAGRTTIRTLTLYADDTPPSISITNPASGQFTSNAVIAVKGTASDNLGLSNVWIQVNGGTWTAATGTTNWTADVSLAGGTNVIRAYAEDHAGNTSPTNSITLDYVVSAPLTVILNGGGTVTPNFNGVLLEIGKTYSMTAQAGSGSVFLNWTGNLTTNTPTLTFVMQSNLTFTANFTDTIRPTLIIKSPAKSLHVSNAVFTATGTAADNGQLAAVWYRLNNGAWTQATNTSNWMAGLALSQSANTLQAYAVDTFNNISITNSVTFTYVPSSRITVLGSGQGTLSPNYNGWMLETGKTYTMIAKAGFNYLFSSWADANGNTLTTTPSLTFTVQSNMTFKVNFLVNPFAPMAGPFAGLFYDTNNIALTNSGYFSGSLTALGAFSTKMQLASGQSASFSARFSPEGVYSNSISVKGSTPLIVQLKLDTVNGGRITGSIAGSGWTSPLVVFRAFYSVLNPAPQGNKKYTLVMPGGDDSTVQPGGNGYGTISMDGPGDVVFSGVLGDGTKVTQTSFISKDGRWPLYCAPYKGLGVVFGWMTFSNEPNTDLNGLINWIRLPQSTAKIYPAGFNFINGVDAVGSIYSFTNGVPLLNLPAGGAAILQQGNPLQSFTNHFTLGTDNKVTSAEGLSVAITTSSGLFKGTAHNPNDGSSVPITGVLLQKQNAAYGFFLGTNQSGAVTFEP